MAYNWQGALYQSPVKYLAKAAKNVAGRFGEYGGNALYQPVSTQVDRLKYALTPQTAYAAESSYPSIGPTRPTRPEGYKATTAEPPAGYYDTQEQTNYDTGGNQSTSGAIEEPEPTYKQAFGGQVYDDPTKYYNAVVEASVTEFNRQNKLLTDAYNAGLLDFAQYQDQIKQARDNVKKQYGEAMGTISGRFSGLSPDAYQSAQGTAENRAQDITNQNYGNIANQEANLNLQKRNYEGDYANKLEANKAAYQNQIDTTYNQTREQLADTSYANALDQLSAPKLNTMTPMDSSILGVYDNLSALQAGGNAPAIRQTIDGLNADPNIKQWLYDRFLPQTI